MLQYVRNSVILPFKYFVFVSKLSHYLSLLCKNSDSGYINNTVSEKCTSWM